jgi:hypothetical protein
MDQGEPNEEHHGQQGLRGRSVRGRHRGRGACRVPGCGANDRGDADEEEANCLPRSFLDAGTEALPGERKFTDYAFPPGPYSTPLATVTNTGGRVGWHNSPLPGPFELPSRYNPYGW